MIMKHCDIVVVTGEYPVEKLTVSDSSTSYVLIKFSVNKSFREFLNTQKNSEKWGVLLFQERWSKRDGMSRSSIGSRNSAMVVVGESAKAGMCNGPSCAITSSLTRNR